MNDFLRINAYYFLIIFLFVSIKGGMQQAFSQNLSTEGDDFWVGFLDNWLQDPDNPIILEIYISADDSTNVHLEIPHYSNQFPDVDTVIYPDQTIRLQIPTSIGMATGTNLIEKKGIHISSDKEVSVYAMNKRQWSADMAVILPTYTLGNDYVIVSHWEEGNRNNNDNSDSEFLVLAVEDNTEIQIVPSHTTEGGNPVDIPFTITLDRGETYQVQARGDLTGTRVTAVANTDSECKQFAVFAGNQYTKVGECDNPNGHDHLFAQMYPVYTWGKEYITVDFNNRRYGDHVKVIAQEDNSEIFLNGNYVKTLSSGEFLFLKELEGVNYISSQKPISVAQFSRSQACDNTYGDPFILLINPNEQVLEKITFFAPTIATIQNFNLSVIAKTSDVPTVKLNGNSINSAFSPVPYNSEFSYAKISVSSGNHTLQSEEGIIAYVYGYGQNESFGYPTGAGLTNLNLDITVLESDGENIPIDSICHKTEIWFKPITEFDFNEFHWDFGDGNTIITDKPDSVPHIYSKPGRYIVELTAYSGSSGCVSGAEQKSVKVVRVRDPSVTIRGPRSVCPNTSDVSYFVDNDKGYSLEWFISGGLIDSLSTDKSISVDWHETNPDAWLKVIPTDDLGCVGDTVTKPVKIKVQLDPEAPFGPDSLCFDPDQPVAYSAYEIPGTFYNWHSAPLNDIAVNDSSTAEITFSDHGYHFLWFEQTSVTDTVCEGISDSLKIYIQREPSEEASLLTDKTVYDIGEEINITLIADTLFQLANWTIEGKPGLDSVSIGYEPIVSYNCPGTYLISAIAIDTVGLCEIHANPELEIEVNTPEIEIIQVSHELDIPDRLLIGWTLQAGDTYTKPVFIYRDGILLDTLFRINKSYLDTALHTSEHSYQYKISTNIDCPENVRSLVHESIRLTAELDENNKGEARLEWNEYSGWIGGTENYELWMMVDDNEFKRLSEQAVSEFPFRSTDLGFEHCFKVKALEAGGNKAYSWSNISCVTFVPELYPYNIITPNGDGLNESFVIENIEHYPNSVLTIFNRWGKQILKIRGYQNNWQGMFNGEVLPNSTYYYVLEINEERSELKSINGMISILR